MGKFAGKYLESIFILLFLFPSFNKIMANDTLFTKKYIENGNNKRFSIELGEAMPRWTYGGNNNVENYHYSLYNYASTITYNTGYIGAITGGTINLGYHFDIIKFAKERIRVGLKFTLFEYWFNPNPDSKFYFDNNNNYEKMRYIKPFRFYLSGFGPQLSCLISPKIRLSANYQLKVVYGTGGEIRAEDYRPNAYYFLESQPYWGIRNCFNFLVKYNRIGLNVGLDYGRNNSVFTLHEFVPDYQNNNPSVLVDYVKFSGKANFKANVAKISIQYYF